MIVGANNRLTKKLEKKNYRNPMKSHRGFEKHVATAMYMLRNDRRWFLAVISDSPQAL